MTDQAPQPQITPKDTKRVTHWHTKGWEAEYYAPYLCLTAPNGDTGLVQMHQNGRNVTLAQFRSSVGSHGVQRACEVFWKLRAACLC